MSELLPCPFCGNEKLDSAYGEDEASICFWIECPPCEIVMERQTKRIAIRDWNNRPSQDKNKEQDDG